MPDSLLHDNPSHAAFTTAHDAARPAGITDSLFRFETPATVARDEAEVPAVGRFAPAQLPSGDGVCGDLPPFTFRTDDGVTCLLLLSAFLAIGTVARAHGFLGELITDFFRPPSRADERDERGTTELRGRFFLYFQAAFALGLLFYAHLQDIGHDRADIVPPHLALAAGTLAALLFYRLKGLAYRVVNGIFFDRAKTSLWADAYLLSILATGLALLPVTLLAIYLDLPPQAQRISFLTVLSIVKILLFFRCFRIFFKHGLGYVHLILYFCALEIAPALMLWRFLLWMNLYLTTNI